MGIFVMQKVIIALPLIGHQKLQYLYKMQKHCKILQNSAKNCSHTKTVKNQNAAMIAKIIKFCLLFFGITNIVKNLAITKALLLSNGHSPANLSNSSTRQNGHFRKSFRLARLEFAKL
jgi:hypothetical protein